MLRTTFYHKISSSNKSTQQFVLHSLKSHVIDIPEALIADQSLPVLSPKTKQNETNLISIPNVLAEPLPKKIVQTPQKEIKLTTPKTNSSEGLTTDELTKKNKSVLPGQTIFNRVSTCFFYQDDYSQAARTLWH